MEEAMKPKFWIELVKGKLSFPKYYIVKICGGNYSLMDSIYGYNNAKEFAQRLSEATGLEIREVK